MEDYSKEYLDDLIMGGDSNDDEMSLDGVSDTENQTILNYEQICRLDDVLNVTLMICGECGLPTLSITIKDFLLGLRQQLEAIDFPYLDIRLNGGAAAYILDKHKGNKAYNYSDVDILINIRPQSVNLPQNSFGSSLHSDLSSISSVSSNCSLVSCSSPSPTPSSHLPRTPSVTSNHSYSDDSLFNNAITAVLSTVQQLLPPSSTIHQNSLRSYLQKLVRITNPDQQNGDSWSLISLGGPVQPRLDLKFAQRLHRKFEFSVDSFQIPLDGMLNFCEAASVKNINNIDDNDAPLSNNPLCSSFISAHFFPTVPVISYWEKLNDALCHLHEKKIHTIYPEQLRGGGLLKYCKLLVNSFTVPQNCDYVLLEKYMCSRFFIDYKDINSQHRTIYNYVQNHFHSTDAIIFLQSLHKVITTGSVCLMNHERRLTLNLIISLMQHERQRYNTINNNNHPNNNTNLPCSFVNASTQACFNNYQIINYPTQICSPISISNNREIVMDNSKWVLDGIVCSDYDFSVTSNASLSNYSSTLNPINLPTKLVYNCVSPIPSSLSTNPTTPVDYD